MSKSIYMNTYVDQDLKDTLTAIAYQLGLKGRFTQVARRFILEGIQRYRDGLTAPKRGDLDEILSNVKIATMLNPKKRNQKSTYIKKKERGGI